MRRMTLLFSMIGLLLLVSSGVVAAANIRCDGGACRGTNGGDRLEGSDIHDKMLGRGGNDRILGRWRGDLMYGQDGADTMIGGYGKDKIVGQGDNDGIYGGPDDDRLFGGDDLDTVNGNRGADYIVVAGDGQTDSVDCGTGRDTAVVDQADLNGATVIEFFRLTSCENVRVR
jgi:Ca2+-binding RTX toxin-like protein